VLGIGEYLEERRGERRQSAPCVRRFDAQMIRGGLLDSRLRMR
jgi:hypothetical protein